MSFRIQHEFKGLAPLVAQLAGFRASLRRQVLRSAMRRGASVVNKTAKSLVTKGATRQLWRSLGVKVKVYPSGVVIGVVEPRAGFRVVARVTRSGRTYYHNPRVIAHLVEGGTQARWTKSGRYTGAAQPKRFLEPALTASEEKVLAIFGEEIEKALARGK